MSHTKFCKCGKPTDSVGACPTCGQFPTFCRCEHVRFPGGLTHSEGDDAKCAGCTPAEGV